jgi:uncharacterized protein (DUF362 family)
MSARNELPDYAPQIHPVSVACEKRKAGRKVALLRCTEEDDLRAKTRQAIALLGGVQPVVHEGDRVFVKVNGTMNRPRENGAVVDARVLQAVVEEAFAAGAAEVAVGDAAVLNQGGTLPIFQQIGYAEVARATGARLLDLNHPPYARVRVPDGGWAYRSLIIREELRPFDVMLNVPKMKTHGTTGVTLGLKNMFGMTPMNAVMGYTKASFHGEVPEAELVRSTPLDKTARAYVNEFMEGRPSGASNDKLIRSVIDHNLIFPSSLVVIDGVIGMQGQGPWSGDPIRSNVLIAGYDLVATDVVATRMMGYSSPDQMPLYDYAVRAGLGDLEFERIELVGDAWEEVATPFERHTGYEEWAAEWLKEKGAGSPK